MKIEAKKAKWIKRFIMLLSLILSVALYLYNYRVVPEDMDGALKWYTKLDSAETMSVEKLEDDLMMVLFKSEDNSGTAYLRKGINDKYQFQTVTFATPLDNGIKSLTSGPKWLVPVGCVLILLSGFLLTRPIKSSLKAIGGDVIYDEDQRIRQNHKLWW